MTNLYPGFLPHYATELGTGVPTTPLRVIWGKTGALKIMSDRYWWHNCRADVSSYVASCVTCDRRKPPSHPKAPQLLHVPPFRFRSEDFGLDHVCRFLRSRRDNKYFFVAVDHLTMWTDINAVPSTSSEPASRFYVCKFFDDKRCLASF